MAATLSPALEGTGGRTCARAVLKARARGYRTVRTGHSPPRPACATPPEPWTPVELLAALAQVREGRWPRPEPVPRLVVLLARLHSQARTVRGPGPACGSQRRRTDTPRIGTLELGARLARATGDPGWRHSGTVWRHLRALERAGAVELTVQQNSEGTEVCTDVRLLALGDRLSPLERRRAADQLARWQEHRPRAWWAPVRLLEARARGARRRPDVHPLSESSADPLTGATASSLDSLTAPRSRWEAPDARTPAHASATTAPTARSSLAMHREKKEASWMLEGGGPPGATPAESTLRAVCGPLMAHRTYDGLGSLTRAQSARLRADGRRWARLRRSLPEPLASLTWSEVLLELAQEHAEARRASAEAQAAWARGEAVTHTAGRWPARWRDPRAVTAREDRGEEPRWGLRILARVAHLFLHECLEYRRERPSAPPVELLPAWLQHDGTAATLTASNELLCHRIPSDHEIAQASGELRRVLEHATGERRATVHLRAGGQHRTATIGRAAVGAAHLPPRLRHNADRT